MQPETWLAWWVYGGGQHPTLFQFIGVLRSEVDVHILELASGTRITVSQRFVDRLTEVENPHLARPEASQRPANLYQHGDGGHDASNALAANAGTPHTSGSLYNERWRKTA